eukprot:2100947-Prorocentrum_lima.AAC.1
MDTEAAEEEEPAWARKLFGKIEEMQTQLINKYNKLEERVDKQDDKVKIQEERSTLHGQRLESLEKD